MRERQISTLSLDQIVVTQGREIDDEVVASIASSIELVGLLSPITVLALEDGNFRLIAGRHRLAAMRSLRRDQIDAQVYRGLSDIEVRIAEIVENLQRAELTRLERAQQTAEYGRLAKEMREQGGAQVGQHPSNVKGASGREGGDSAAARDLGLTRQEIQRAEQIDAIDPEIKATAIAEGLGNNQSALLKIAAAPKEQQHEIIKELSIKKPRKKRSTPRAGNDVQATVEATLRDFSVADVQLIVDGLSKGLAERRVDVTPEASAHLAEDEKEVIDDRPTATSELGFPAEYSDEHGDSPFTIDSLDDIDLENPYLVPVEYPGDLSAEQIEELMSQVV